MKTLKCELCGSNEFVKQEGMYQCQDCRTKLTVDEAKKMIIDDSPKADNLMVRARQFFQDGNLSSAQTYCERVLDIDAFNAAAITLSKEIGLTGKLNEANTLKDLCKLADEMKGTGAVEVEKEFHVRMEKYITTGSAKFEVSGERKGANKFQKEILFMDGAEIPDQLKALHKKLTQEYVELVIEGDILFNARHISGIDKYQDNLPYKCHNTVLLEILNKGNEYAKQINEKIKKYPPIWIPDYLSSYLLGAEDMRDIDIEYNPITFMFGRTIQFGHKYSKLKRSKIAIDGSIIQAIDQHFEKDVVKLNKILDKAAKRRSKNRCALCGGVIESMSCKSCKLFQLGGNNNDKELILYYFRAEKGLCGYCGKKYSEGCECKRKPKYGSRSIKTY